VTRRSSATTFRQPVTRQSPTAARVRKRSSREEESNLFSVCVQLLGSSRGFAAHVASRLAPRPVWRLDQGSPSCLGDRTSPQRVEDQSLECRIAACAATTAATAVCATAGFHPSPVSACFACVRSMQRRVARSLSRCRARSMTSSQPRPMGVVPALVASPPHDDRTGRRCRQRGVSALHVGPACVLGAVTLAAASSARASPSVTAGFGHAHVGAGGRGHIASRGAGGELRRDRQFRRWSACPHDATVAGRACNMTFQWIMLAALGG